MGIDETELLRSCLQVRYGPRRDAALAERTRGLDTDGWESLRVHSEAERLAPLLHDAVAGRVAGWDSPTTLAWKAFTAAPSIGRSSMAAAAS